MSLLAVEQCATGRANNFASTLNFCMNARHVLFCLYIASVAMSALTAADVSSILWLVSVASARTVIRVSAFTAQRCFVEGKKRKVCALQKKVFIAV